MTAAEKAAYAVKMGAVKSLREAEREKIHTECRRWCADTWEKAKDATSENPYLKRKSVNAYGIKALKDSLIIPVRDMAGKIHGLQFIKLDGSKFFKAGTNKVGHFFKIGQSKDNTVFICEGYATGATIHQATGQSVVIAFDSGNLLSVAETIRAKFPDMKIIISADDDHTTEGNPGLTKATEAARAVNGLLAVPVFPDSRQATDSDFNDLARLSGLEAVRKCIEAAAIPSPVPEIETRTINSLEEAVDRLAALSPMEYDRVRKTEAKELGVRPRTLDAAVKDARKGSINDDLPFVDVDPWPNPIDPAMLLSDISATVRRFIVCSEETAHAVSLWVAMTWFIDVVQVAPLAVITAPEKECGKSLLLTLIGKLVARPITSSNISPAALFRAIDAWTPTLLIDEADTFMRDNEELRGLLNSGHTRDSAYVVRAVGETFQPTKFSTWGAKAISGIGHIADTLMSRAIVFELRRKLPHEKVDRLRQAEQYVFNDLRAKLARFADDCREEVRLARPPLPQSLGDRQQDNWEPLLTIAMTAGNEWLSIGTTAALKISGSESATHTIGTELLSDIKEIFEEKQLERITMAELVKALCADDEKTWASYNKGFPITTRQISKKLSGYGIKSKTVRIGLDTAKGYEKNQFQDAFIRYIPSPQGNSVTLSQFAPAKGLSVTEAQSRYQSVTEEKIPNLANTFSCDNATERNPLNTEIFIDETDLVEVRP